MHPEELVAIADDNRTIVEASSLWMLISALKGARPGRYLLFRIRSMERGSWGYPLNETHPHGLALVDDKWIDVREHGPDKKLKRRILVENPRHPRPNAVASIE